ncbi:cation diffusion facilitator family transporter [Microbulbifer yueqingensis]|uniref:Cation diffusion facilitator family transporter n=1 Tax=Microbulbifer yueqingensis TaxID=658219 RepID=A0A1G8Y5J2_9GAMM|nr:cation transporter [Microbulbifer yueqingensis]SDJ98021.1 cation diffusion facilitator family transporter [Microbulbifer yueqingensis]
MTVLAERYKLPEEKQDKLQRAIRLEWLTIFFLITITIVMYLAMGSSQAMKTAWVEDVLSLIPPISFLVAMRYRNNPPTDRFPYGFRRAPLLSFMVAAVAILVLGLYLLYDAGKALLEQHHPTLAHFHLFGNSWDIWSGWVMIAALIYSVIPPVILGRMKLRLAPGLQEKTLFADANMNKADWMTAVAAGLGIVGVGFGFWWADSVAAAVISLDVIKDGVTNVKRATSDLLGQSPTDVKSGKQLGLADKLSEELGALQEVQDVGVRLREEGHVFSGEVFVVLSSSGDTARQVEHIRERATALDWRLHNLTVMPVTTLEK